jgi:hypothetical protein
LVLPAWPQQNSRLCQYLVAAWHKTKKINNKFSALYLVTVFLRNHKFCSKFFWFCIVFFSRSSVVSVFFGTCLFCFDQYLVLWLWLDMQRRGSRRKFPCLIGFILVSLCAFLNRDHANINKFRLILSLIL